jgi:hypothetical protein
MRIRANLLWVLGALALALNSANVTAAATADTTIDPIGTTFTYQGRLELGGSPANGIYDLRFTLYDAATNGATVAGPLTNSAVAISDGLFTVALNFGPVFYGTGQWLQVDVRKTGVGSFTSLAPLQALTAVPYALLANAAANLAGTLPAAQLSGTVPLGQLPATLLTNGQAGVSLTGTFGGNAAGLTNLNAGALASGTVPLARLPNQGFAVPQMFGAVGDGVADDTVALQTWINYCASNRLEARLSAASVYYKISNWLMITNAVTIRGPGEGIHFPDADPPARAHIRQTSPTAGVFLIQGDPYNIPPPDCTRFEQIFCSASAFNTNGAFAFDGQWGATDNARIISCGASNFLYGILNASACVLRVESSCFTGVGWGYYQGRGRYFTSTNIPVLNVNEVANTTIGAYSNCVFLAFGTLTLDNCDIGGPTLAGPAILQTGGLLCLNSINLENGVDAPAIVSVNGDSIQIRGGAIMDLGFSTTNTYSLVLSNSWAIIEGTVMAPNSEGFEILESNPQSQIWSSGPYRERLWVQGMAWTNITGMFLTTLPSLNGWPSLWTPGGPLPGVYGTAPTFIFGQGIDGFNQTAIYVPVGMEEYTHDSFPVFVDLLQYQKDRAGGLAASYAWSARSVTNGGSGTFTGVFTGNGGGLTNIPLMALQAAPLTNGEGGVTLNGLTTVSNLSVTGTNLVNYLAVANPPALNGSAITGLNASQLASGIVPSGQLAGLYSNAVVFSSPLNGFQGSYFTGGTFTGNGAGLTNLPASAGGLFACRHTPVGITNSALPTTVYSVLIPANAIGSNGTLRASCLLSANGSTGVEVLYYYGGTLMTGFTGPAGYKSLFGMREIANRNAPNSQISFPTGSPAVYGSTNQAPPLRQAFDTSTNFTFSIVLSSSGHSQTNTLETADVEILHRD